ncbi:Bug family tripartite tricarboxylate transporter substrate binding protein [Variovorax paradoxus]|uniref:Tripartite tricarboxylate transporter substrate binding protein n=1 Tax=Variovorax paradoxus TaxID=34073 RepID=A0A6I6HKH9_VARPD|nr:tripartite tricarboxylate transporter substrate binding protein [Variovorax paradoxus]QGW83406.1 tripartite tricarboxylate transporter substrate binding protein [Variovorax paradoxus]
MKALQLVAVGAFLLAHGAASAQASYPTKPITLVLGFPPGGGADAVARPLAEALGRELGQAVIVENKPGAGTTIASTFVARAAPDGYTIYMAGVSHMGPDKVLYKNTTYSASSFTSIARWTRTPLILAVSSASGIHSTKDLIDKAKANPEGLFYTSSGAGGAPHLAALQFMNATGAKMTHLPFKGGAPAVQAVAAGDAQLTFGTPPSIIPLAQTGKVKMIAVTSANRSGSFPELPSIAEAGVKDYDYTFWFGLFGPAKMPPEIVNRLAEASAKVLGDPAMRAKLAAGGNEASPSKNAAEFAAWTQAEAKLSTELTVQSGAKLD